MTSLPASPALRAPALPWVAWGLLLASGAIALGPLTPTWNSNSNYSFGWLIPLVCLFLLHERWPTRPPRTASGQIPLTIPLIAWGFVFLAFRLIAEADPDWRPGLWVIVLLYLGAVLTWLWLYGGTPWLRHFAFPVCFLLLCLPWFFGIEYPLVQGLMRWNARLVADSLQAIAIYAKPEGNIIHLQNCQLGVEEACSGILSLQASLMMGCLLGEIYRLSTRNRFALVLSAILLALLGNYLRTLFLALMAFYDGGDAVPRWHDTAGYAILVFTGLGTWVASLCLAPRTGTDAPTMPDVTPPPEIPPRQDRLAWRLAIGLFVAALLAEVATHAWFAWKESSLTRHPEWAIHWPPGPSYQREPLSDVTLEALRCDESSTARWNDAHGWNWTLFWIRYHPKPYTRIVLGWHNPDNCLPAVGLVKDRGYPDFIASANGIDLRVQPKKFHSGDTPVYIFWIVYPNSGELPPDRDTRIPLSFSAKIQTHFSDVLQGNRGVGVETMEVAIAGPPDYESAQTAFLDAMKKMVVPGPAGEDLAAETFHN